MIFWGEIRKFSVWKMVFTFNPEFYVSIHGQRKWLIKVDARYTNIIFNRSDLNLSSN